MKTIDDIKYIDLFCGLGSFHIAMDKVFKNAKCVFASDKDAHASKIYKLNFKIDPFSDITKIPVINIPKHDVLFAGFPCQPFSNAGKKLGFMDKTRGTLFHNIIEIAKHHRPKLVILENVAGLKHHDNHKTLNIIIKSLEELGYYVKWKIFNSANLGSYTNRERIIVVASFDEFSDIKIPLKKFRKLSTLNLDKTNKVPKEKYVLLPNDVRTVQKSGLIFSGYIKGNKFKTANQEKDYLSRLHRQTNRIYDIHGTHPTLSGSEGSGRYYISDGDNVFKLNVNDAYRIMNFPRKYKKIGSSSELFKRIGNSIDVKLSENIVKWIKEEFYD